MISRRDAIVLLVIVPALAACAFITPPLALLFVLMPASFVAAGCALAAVVRPEGHAPILRAGHRGLGLLCVLALVTLFSSRTDWMYTLWSVQYALSGLFFGAGLVLVRVWPEDRRQHPDLMHGWNGAAVALAALLLFGSIPVLEMIQVDARGVGRASGSTLTALLEAARYGFGGTVPALMQPESADQIARGLGHPPRFVTVTMGATLLAAGCWILFVALALIGRAIPAGKARWNFFLLTPLLLAPASVLFHRGAWDAGIWRNQPWLVKSYGPTLLAAAVAGLVLLVVLYVKAGSTRSEAGSFGLHGTRPLVEHPEA